MAYQRPCIGPASTLAEKHASLTNASCGLGIYLSEGNQLVLVASVADIPYIGILQYVEDGYAYVKLVTQVCTGA